MGLARRGNKLLLAPSGALAASCECCDEPPPPPPPPTDCDCEVTRSFALNTGPGIYLCENASEYGHDTVSRPPCAPQSGPVLVTVKGSVNDDLLIDGVVTQPNQFPFGPCNGAHNVDYAFLLTAASFAISVRDNHGSGTSYDLTFCFPKCVVFIRARIRYTISGVLQPGFSGLIEVFDPADGDKLVGSITLPSTTTGDYTDIGYYPLKGTTYRIRYTMQQQMGCSGANAANPLTATHSISQCGEQHTRGAFWFC